MSKRAPSLVFGLENKRDYNIKKIQFHLARWNRNKQLIIINAKYTKPKAHVIVQLKYICIEVLLEYSVHILQLNAKRLYFIWYIKDILNQDVFNFIFIKGTLNFKVELLYKFHNKKFNYNNRTLIMTSMMTLRSIKPVAFQRKLVALNLYTNLSF